MSRRKSRRTTARKKAARERLPVRYAGGKPADYRGEKIVNGTRVRT